VIGRRIENLVPTSEAREALAQSVAHGWVRLAQGDALHVGGEKRSVESGAGANLEKRPGRLGERIPAQRLHAGTFAPGEE
jgi:hypothetical protein